MCVLGLKMLSFVEIPQGNRNRPVEAADDSPASEGQTHPPAGGTGQGRNEFQVYALGAFGLLFGMSGPRLGRGRGDESDTQSYPPRSSSLLC